MKKLIVALTLLLSLAAWSPALADSFSSISLTFSRITDNSPVGDQVNVVLDISQFDTDTLLFRFTNQSVLQSVVAEIYFYDALSLVGSMDIRNDLNVGLVTFLPGAHPGSLPGGDAYGFKTSFAALATESTNPSPTYGINPGESLSLLLNFSSAAAINSLVAGLNDRDFMVGLHVVSIAGVQSDSFINDPPGGQVPEPASMLLMGSGLLLVGRLRKRWVKK
ncbi:MAG: PEP-CTERM sorting domain-containing protein [Thermodesulfobacteriota bacterium]